MNAVTKSGDTSRWLLIAVCVIVAAASAVLSASATHAEVLHQRAVTSPTLAWLAVAVFEGGALYLALAQSRLSGRAATLHQVGLTVLLLTAVAINVLHAWTNGARSFGLLIGGMLPLVLIAILHSAWHQSAEAAKRLRHETREALKAEVREEVLADIEADTKRVEEAAREARERKAREREERSKARSPEPGRSAPLSAVPSAPTVERSAGALTKAERIEQIIEWLEAGEALVGPTVAERLAPLSPPRRGRTWPPRRSASRPLSAPDG